MVPALTTCGAADSAPREREQGLRCGATALEAVTGVCRRRLPPGPDGQLESALPEASGEQQGLHATAEKRDSPCGTPLSPVSHATSPPETAGPRAPLRWDVSSRVIVRLRPE